MTTKAFSLSLAYTETDTFSRAFFDGGAHVGMGRICTCTEEVSWARDRGTREKVRLRKKEKVSERERKKEMYEK